MSEAEVTTQVRWLIRRDMHDVLIIERASFPDPWTEEDFLHCLRQRYCIGMVAERDGLIVGYMIYTLHDKRLELLNLAVLPDCRRQGVGRAMVDKLIDKLNQQRRRRISLKVIESNLPGQLFFRAMGFRARKVVHGWYDTTDEDAYLMDYRIKAPVLTGD